MEPFCLVVTCKYIAVDLIAARANTSYVLVHLPVLVMRLLRGKISTQYFFNDRSRRAQEIYPLPSTKKNGAIDTSIIFVSEQQGPKASLLILKT